MAFPVALLAQLMREKAVSAVASKVGGGGGGVAPSAPLPFTPPPAKANPGEGFMPFTAPTQLAPTPQPQQPPRPRRPVNPQGSILRGLVA